MLNMPQHHHHTTTPNNKTKPKSTRQINVELIPTNYECWNQTIAVFLPVVAGNGGIVGTQTLTLMIRSMATGDVPRRSGLRLLGKELLLGLIHGAFLGVAVGLLAYAWKGNVMLGVVVGIAMIGTMPIAGLAGAATPLVLRALRVDPAAGSAVIVTTVTDVTGFLLLLGLATILITYLL